MSNSNRNNSNFDRSLATGIPSNDDISRLFSAHRRYAKSYKENQRKVKMFKIAKRIAWVLFAADVWFSYLGIQAFSGSFEFALFTAVFVGAGQWVVSESLLSKSFGSLMKIDADSDGEITISEWLRWGIHLSALIVVYGLDIATNLAAINGEVLGTLPFTIAGDATAGNIPGWAAWTVSLIICGILCFADEWIHSISDSRLAELESEQPALKERAAVIEAKLAEAGAFGETILSKATERGTQRGAAY